MGLACGIIQLVAFSVIYMFIARFVLVGSLL